jgi:hypothetical protein
MGVNIYIIERYHNIANKTIATLRRAIDGYFWFYGSKVFFLNPETMMHEEYAPDHNVDYSDFVCKDGLTLSDRGAIMLSPYKPTIYITGLVLSRQEEADRLEIGDSGFKSLIASSIYENTHKTNHDSFIFNSDLKISEEDWVKNMIGSASEAKPVSPYDDSGAAYVSYDSRIDGIDEIALLNKVLDLWPRLQKAYF